MKRGIRKGLSPEKVVDAALQIVDAEGVEALTMRRLGAELGVAPMAIYNHFPDREALLDGLAERAFEGLSLQTQDDGWRRRIRAVIRSVHKLAVDHPNVYAMIMSRPNKPRASFALMTEAMTALRQAGLSEPDSVQWYHTFLMLIQGFPVWRASLTQYCSSAEAQLAGLSPAQMEVWKAVHSVSADDQFERAVETLLDVLETKTSSLQ